MAEFKLLFACTQDYGIELRSFRMHVATMTGLLPNRVYYYIVGGLLPVVVLLLGVMTALAF